MAITENPTGRLGIERMNIFVTDSCPVQSARNLCDKHIVKMILEAGQLLSTAHHVLDGLTFKTPYLYKPTHENHPYSIWVRQSTGNYSWLYQHFEALHYEYFYRYGKTHKSWLRLHQITNLWPFNMPKYEPCSEFVYCGTDEHFKGDVIEAYRAYYREKANRMDMRWTDSVVPTWMAVELA